ncbi:MAG TPA: hypothetical protein VFF23_02930 [Hanamia sp.]|nr:hypothetical protein [Hanamia sp.]
MKKIIFLLAIGFILSVPATSNAQLLKKLKEKASSAVNKAIDSKTGNETQENANSSSSESSSQSTSGNRPINKGGVGLKNTAPPDVNAAMEDANKSFTANNYSDARYSVQQALMGIEIQLGHELLKSLPANVDGMDKDTMQDKVVSTQWGWNNMTIQRVYSDKKDKQCTITIGNNMLYSGLVNAYFGNAYAVESNGKDQNVKQVKVQGNKAIISYDESKGYTLIVPVGQSSMVVWECINFANEDEVMNTANAFSIDNIKKTLGEK